jgi:hypothetical protein
VHGIHHELQGGVNNGTGFFRVEPFNQGRRAFEVCKQGGDGLAFTVGDAPRCQRRLLGENTLGQMRGV